MFRYVDVNTHFCVYMYTYMFVVENSFLLSRECARGKEWTRECEKILANVHVWECERVYVNVYVYTMIDAYIDVLESPVSQTQSPFSAKVPHMHENVHTSDLDTHTHTHTQCAYFG